MTAMQLTGRAAETPEEEEVAPPSVKRAKKMSVVATEMYTRSEYATAALLSLLDDLASSSSSFDSLLTKATAEILTLKQTQRALCLTVESSLASKLSSSQEQLKQATLALSNLLYEKHHLQTSIDHCRDRHCPFLLNMARQELDHNHDTDAQDRENNYQDDVIHAFFASSTNHLQGSHYKDVTNHTTNIETLQTELAQRSKIQDDYLHCLSQKQQLSTSYQTKVDFLKSVPRTLEAVEASTLPLQQFFHASYDNTLTIGSKRKQRLDTARLLPGPLYTLFVQLHGCIDFCNNNDDDDSLDIQIVKLSPFQLDSKDLLLLKSRNNTKDDDDAIKHKMEKLCRRDTHALQLLLSVISPKPFIVAGRGKNDDSVSNKVTLTIQFEYLVELKVVTAHVLEADGGTSLDWSGLLMTLFHDNDDYGIELPNGAAYFDSPTTTVLDAPQTSSFDEDYEGSSYSDETEHSEALDIHRDPIESRATVVSPITIALQIMRKRKDCGRPYRWCQYISGLHYPGRNTAATSPTPFCSNGNGSVTAIDINDEKTEQNFDEVNDKISSQHIFQKKKQQNETRLEPSTMAVLQQLRRRIRSRLTLMFHLDCLSEQKKPNPIPVHPSMFHHATTTTTCAARLISWTAVEFPHNSNNDDDAKFTTTMEEEDDGWSTYLCYVAIIKRKSITLRATVRIHVMYPAIPPIWNLQQQQPGESVTGSTTPSWGEQHGTITLLTNNETAIGTTIHDGQELIPASKTTGSRNVSITTAPPLYDSMLGQIEACVNSLDTVSTNNNNNDDDDEDGFVNDNNKIFNEMVEESYDWMLLHQLHEIIASWDEFQQALEETGSIGSRSGNNGRLVKGRDRRRYIGS